MHIWKLDLTRADLVSCANTRRCTFFIQFFSPAQLTVNNITHVYVLIANCLSSVTLLSLRPYTVTVDTETFFRVQDITHIRVTSLHVRRLFNQMKLAKTFALEKQFLHNDADTLFRWRSIKTWFRALKLAAVKLYIKISSHTSNICSVWDAFSLRKYFSKYNFTATINHHVEYFAMTYVCKKFCLNIYSVL